LAVLLPLIACLPVCLEGWRGGKVLKKGKPDTTLSYHHDLLYIGGRERVKK
jgi:hypothetical protein